MSPELCAWAAQLSRLLDGARPVPLPAPYSAGHFRIYTQAALADQAQFTARRSGSTLFVTVRDAALLQALRADIPPLALPEPSADPLHTLLYQILTYGFVPDEMDCPLLARLALDLDGDPARCRRTARQLQPLLARQYACALRTGRSHSALALVAGRLLAHDPILYPRNGGIHP